MTLSFAEKINNIPTYFIQKIWFGFYFRKDDICDQYQKYHTKYIEKFKDNFDNKDYDKLDEYEKLHTIREDKSNRWKAGNDIHMVIYENGKPINSFENTFAQHNPLL